MIIKERFKTKEGEKKLEHADTQTIAHKQKQRKPAWGSLTEGRQNLGR